ncbi:hypothetical protein ACQP25_05150 [Microtetraspora malaysiensis]
MEWTPAECTLPTEERPLRVAEFDELFASALYGLEPASQGEGDSKLLPH